MATTSGSIHVSAFSLRHMAFVVPLILLHLSCLLIFVVGVSAIAAVACALTATLQIYGVTTGYHRLLAHRSFKTGRTFRILVTVFGVLAGQNGPLWWVGHHRHHHRHSDTDDDPHSPRVGLLWGHMGWLLSPGSVPMRRYLVRDLERLPEMRFLQDYYYVINLSFAVLLFLVGEFCAVMAPDLGVSGLQLVVWGCVMSTVLSYHAIWSANSIGHRFGSRRFPTRDDSRNNLLVALLTFGDGWHHNHHYCPNSSRHGFRWWEVDLNFAILKLLAWLGIVWDLGLPPRQGGAAQVVQRRAWRTAAALRRSGASSPSVNQP